MYPDGINGSDKKTMIKLYTGPTNNGKRASVLLEEMGVEYEAEETLIKGNHRTPDYQALNPIGKIPTIVDPDGPGGEPYTLYETTAIAFYLSDKSGRFQPRDAREKAEILKWCSIVVSGFNSIFGLLFSIQRHKWDVPQVREHYLGEAHRYLKVMDDQLAKTAYLAGEDYTIADMMAYPEIATVAQMQIEDLAKYENIARWREAVAARDAVERGMAVPKKDWGR